MRRPQASIADHGLEQPVVESVERQRTARMRDVQGEPRRRHRDRDVAGQARRAAGIRHPPDHEETERRVVDADEVALVGAAVEVVHALRRVRAGAAPTWQHAIELRYDEAASHERRLVDHVGRGGVEVQRVERGAAELVHADVERVLVHAERRVVAETRRRAAHAALRAGVGPLIQGPHGAQRNRAGAADRDHVAVRHRDVDHDDEPAIGAAVVAYARVRRAREVAHGVEERIGRGVDHAVREPRRLADRPDAPVDADEILRRTYIPLRVGRVVEGVGAVAGDVGIGRGRRVREGGGPVAREGGPRGPLAHGRRGGIVGQESAIRPDLADALLVVGVWLAVAIGVDHRAGLARGDGHEVRGGPLHGRRTHPRWRRRALPHDTQRAIDAHHGGRSDAELLGARDFHVRAAGGRGRRARPLRAEGQEQDGLDESFHTGHLTGTIGLSSVGHADVRSCAS